MIKILKRFQEDAVMSGLAVFARAKELLDAAPADAESRARTVTHNGYLLIEAPTGSGKTLIAGNIVERFSVIEDVVWFWFAPFKGVTGQTAGFLREQFAGIRLRELSDDRDAGVSRKGDVFVTTWQTVATRVKDRRNVRRDGEQNPSVDTMIQRLRKQGLRIGVVVDEAHHSFHGDTQAATFFRNVLAPEYTVLVTATPDDQDIEDFRERMGVAEIQRTRIGRQEAVDAGLIKTGVKCAAYLADSTQRKLADLEGLALRDGVAVHRAIARALQKARVSLTPLLLVQVDSREDEPDGRTEQSVKRVKERLLALGFKEEQIAVHTAKEPDAGLLALANDETREVLIFKMAVALGFDAPRAFTLVSMRASRDPDFGVQLVGRILRVHRRLQGLAMNDKLSEELRYGYVFLADPETQTGIDMAGQRINAMRTEYAQVSLNTVVVRMVSRDEVRETEANGQITFGFENAPSPGAMDVPPATDKVDDQTSAAEQPTLDLGKFFARPAEDSPATTETAANAAKSTGETAVMTGPYRYPLREGLPRRFKTQRICADNEVTEAECAQRFAISTKELFEVLNNKIGVQRRTIEVFTHQMEMDLVGADLSPARVALLADKALRRSDLFDARELRLALLAKVQAVLRERAMEGADDPERAAHFLRVILATHPELLYEAQKATLAATAEVQETDEALPNELISDAPLARSGNNVYGRQPPGLNSWEKLFAEMTDADPNGIVRWWHRNLPHKPWSVNVLMPDGHGFFPDFVVGIAGRKTEGGVLLVDTKWAFSEEASKVQAVHGTYGRVLILNRQGTQWFSVRYDVRQEKPVLDREFRLTDAAAWGA